jgi:tetratricopeptide (TPR) repeat protein
MKGHRWLRRGGKSCGWGSLLCLVLVGCNHAPVHSPLDAALQSSTLQAATVPTGGLRALWRQSPQLSIPIPQSTTAVSNQGPPKPETIAILAQVQLDAAFAEETSPASRELLLDQARQGFQKALQQDPKNPTALLGLAQYHARLGERHKALEIFQRYLRYYPHDNQVRHQLALVHAQWKDWEGAVRWCDEALHRDPESRSIRKTKGFCLARAGRYEEALATFLEIMPESLARYHLARVLEHMGHVDASRHHLQLALQADPSCEQARQFLAELITAYAPTTSSPTSSDRTSSLLPAGHLSPASESSEPSLPAQDQGNTTPHLPLGGIPVAPSGQR